MLVQDLVNDFHAFLEALKALALVIAVPFVVLAVLWIYSAITGKNI